MTRYYLLHVHEGTLLSQHGPFNTMDEAFQWRSPRYDTGDEPAELEVTPYTWDDYASDTWILVTAIGDGTIETEIP